MKMVHKWYILFDSGNFYNLIKKAWYGIHLGLLTFLIFVVLIASNQPKLKLDYSKEDGDYRTIKIALFYFIGILYMGPIMGLSFLSGRSTVKLGQVELHQSFTPL